MKLGVKLGALLVCLLMTTTIALPQDQAKSSTEQPASHVRIDFLLTEYNGQQKINSLPYTMSTEAVADTRPGYTNTSIRMGVKVPIAEGVSAQGAPTQFNYQDIGTDIDCRAKDRGDGSYDLDLFISRSSVYAEVPSAAQPQAEALRTVGTQPVIQAFRTNFLLRMHDGETTDGTSATDPFNGHVLKITVTLHVIK